MKKAIKIVGIILLGVFLMLQFFQTDKTNPPIVEAETLDAAATVPADVSQIIARSCNDCHSNKTIYPWYANVQPVGWYLKSHMDDGKREVNFSVFNTYSPKKKAKKFEEICEQIEKREMPLPSYLWMHGDAVLGESDAKALCDWANQERAKIVL